MDFADEAAAAADKYLRGALGRIGAAGGGESATECGNCGCLIPEARRRAVPGCVLCVCCQQEEERYAT